MQRVAPLKTPLAVRKLHGLAAFLAYSYLYRMINRPASYFTKKVLQAFTVVLLLINLLSFSPQASGGSRASSTHTQTEWVTHKVRPYKHVSYFNADRVLSAPSFSNHARLHSLAQATHHYILFQQKKFQLIKVNLLRQFVSSVYLPRPYFSLLAA